MKLTTTLGIMLAAFVSLGYSSKSHARLEGTFTITPSSATTKDNIVVTWNTNVPEGQCLFIDYLPATAAGQNYSVLSLAGGPAHCLPSSGSVTVTGLQLIQYYLWYFPNLTHKDFIASMKTIYISSNGKRSRATQYILDQKPFDITVVP